MNPEELKQQAAEAIANVFTAEEMPPLPWELDKVLMDVREKVVKIFTEKQ